MRTVIVLPHPPGIVSRAQMYAELAQLCFAQIRDAIDHDTTTVGVVAAVDPPFRGNEHNGGSLGVFGIDEYAGGDHATLPPVFAIGAWLLDEIGWQGPRVYTSAEIPDTDVVIVLADGSAKRDESAPGFFDPSAQDFDDTIAQALAVGDTQVLSDLDDERAWFLWCYDTPALRLMSTLVPQESALIYYDAPFGVGYWIAQWQL